MCGIFAIFGNSCADPGCVAGNNAIIRAANGIHEKTALKTVPKESFREMAYRCSSKQRHRGPDKTGVVEFKDKNVIMIHERLRIIGVTHGDQPMQNEDGNVTLVTNGEIYNFLQISDELSMFYKRSYVARSDCDVIIGLYEKYGDDLVHHITGMYAFALYDRKNNKMLAARDPFGIVSMYIGVDANENIWIASEMKCLTEKCLIIKNFPIGKYLESFICIGERKMN
jgi:asparagine synthase (glutamine-hydrolysing)